MRDGFHRVSRGAGPNPLLAIVMVLALSGCMSSGTKVTEQQAAQFTPGTTTRSQVIATLGQPSRTMINPDGSTTIIYVHISTSANAATFIPVVGALAGGASTSNDQAIFYFDKAGFLTRHSSSYGNQEVSTGLLGQ